MEYYVEETKSQIREILMRIVTDLNNGENASSRTVCNQKGTILSDIRFLVDNGVDSDTMKYLLGLWKDSALNKAQPAAKNAINAMFVDFYEYAGKCETSKPSSGKKDIGYRYNR